MGASFIEEMSTGLTRGAMAILRLSPDIGETAARVIALREHLGMSKADFADSIEVDRSSWTKIEKCDKPLHADHAYRISVKFSVPMDFIYRGVVKDLPASFAEYLRNR